MRDPPGAQQSQLHSGLSEPCKVKARKLWAAPCSGQISSLWCGVLAGTCLCWTITFQEDGSAVSVTVECSSKTASLCPGFPCCREVLTAHLCLLQFLCLSFTAWNGKPEHVLDSLESEVGVQSLPASVRCAQPQRPCSYRMRTELSRAHQTKLRSYKGRSVTVWAMCRDCSSGL